jgi:hypothetical protein
VCACNERIYRGKLLTDSGLLAISSFAAKTNSGYLPEFIACRNGADERFGLRFGSLNVSARNLENKLRHT